MLIATSGVAYKDITLCRRHKKTEAAYIRPAGDGSRVEYLDLGGGLGIRYGEEEPPLPTEYGKAVVEETGDLGLHLLFEPGRNLVGNAGILVAKCLYTKEGEEKNFVIVDAAMNDLAASLYGSYHGVQ